MIKAISKRHDYPCLGTHRYLNQASLGLIGEPAVMAMHQFLDETARHGNLKMSDAEETVVLEPLRSKVAKLVDQKENNIAIVSSASQILGQLPYLIAPKTGDKIIFVATDFPAITHPWIAYSAENPLNIFFVEECIGKNITDLIIESLDERTAAVCVSYIQYSSGLKINIPKLRAATSLLGVKLIVDITQAAGAVPISLRDWNVDVAVCSGYKWLGGHGGIAFASFCDKILTKVPASVGWFGAENPFAMDATRLILSQTASKYTQSTMSYISVVGLNAAMEQLLNIGITNIEAHSKRLASILARGLKESSWRTFNEMTENEASSHIIAIESDEFDTHKMYAKLIKSQIICGVRNNRIRISIAHYNNEEDIQSLLYNLG